MDLKGSQALNNHFRALSRQDSIIQTWRGVKEKLQNHKKAGPTERDPQRSNYLVYERGGERGT